MGKHAQLVIGPAGSGKSTYCNTIQEHCQATGRNIHIINLDPAAEQFSYTPTMGARPNCQPLRALPLLSPSLPLTALRRQTCATWCPSMT
jgi:ABC-type branched-subunit amino acid transport system ATPase component